MAARGSNNKATPALNHWLHHVVRSPSTSTLLNAHYVQHRALASAGHVKKPSHATNVLAPSAPRSPHPPTCVRRKADCPRPDLTSCPPRLIAARALPIHSPISTLSSGLRSKQLAPCRCPGTMQSPRNAELRPCIGLEGDRAVSGRRRKTSSRLARALPCFNVALRFLLLPTVGMLSQGCDNRNIIRPLRREVGPVNQQSRAFPARESSGPCTILFH